MTFLTKSPRKSVKRFELFPEIDDMRREMETLFDQFERRFPMMPALEGPWTPVLDVFEKGENLVVKTDLPGVPKEDVKVYVTDHTLVIEGERRHEETIEEDDYHRREVSYGSFLRRIPLPEGVETEKVEANFEDGVLEVMIPKGIEARPKSIPIS